VHGGNALAIVLHTITEGVLSDTRASSARDDFQVLNDSGNSLQKQSVMRKPYERSEVNSINPMIISCPMRGEAA